MFRYTLGLSLVLVLLFLAGVTTAEAHKPSQGSQDFSVWRDVTWNDRYVVVRHKHMYDGTICEALRSNPNRSQLERFKLASTTANNRDCVPD